MDTKERKQQGTQNTPFAKFDDLQQILSGPRETEEELREWMKELTELKDRLSKKIRNRSASDIAKGGFENIGGQKKTGKKEKR